MIDSRLVIVALTVLTASCSGGGGDDTSAFGGGGVSSGGRSPICTTLDSYIGNDAASDSAVRGYSFAVFDGNETLLSCAGGDQNMDTVLPIASASKLPAAAAIMTLVDSNQLMLDLPVAVYLLGSGIN
ncbi:MAG: beta-lactamase family protein, partial [Pseudomonadota bacterium]|nr:beta-lactamase family protein [Pseudomonadota bacterium]